MRIEIRSPINPTGNAIGRASAKVLGYVGTATNTIVTFGPGVLGNFDVVDTPTMTYHIQTIYEPSTAIVPEPVIDPFATWIQPDGTGQVTFVQPLPVGLTRLEYVFTPMFTFP